MNDYHWLPLPSPILGIKPDPRRKKALLGFLAGPENRLAETAVRLALGWVPFYADSPLSFALSQKVNNSRKMKKGRADRIAAGKGESFGSSSFDWRLAPPVLPDGTSPSLIDYVPPTNIPSLFPMVFYGPSGCGKTQLAAGICRELNRRNPLSAGVILSAGDFYRSLTNAIAENRVGELRTELLRRPVLVLDDLEELEESPAGIAELLNILRATENDGPLVILTLSRHPDTILSFPAPLRARLVGGLLVPIAFPSRRSRALLLRRYAASFQIRLLPDVEDFMNDTFPESPGMMYDIFSQLYYRQQWDKDPPNPEKIEKFFRERQTAAPLTIERIAKAAARAYSVKLGDLRSKTRRKTVVTARNMTLYIARGVIEVTLQELGRYFAGRDHSTVLHGIRSIAEKIEIDDELKLQHDRIMSTLGKAAKIG